MMQDVQHFADLLRQMPDGRELLSGRYLQTTGQDQIGLNLC